MSAAPRTDRVARWGALGTAVIAAVLSMTSARSVHAQAAVLLQGLADGEFWSTSGHSNFLTRNGGAPAALGRVQLWGAYEPLPRLVFYAQGELEGGNARRDVDNEDVYTDQFGIRYAASRALVVDAGRLTPVIGTFAPRRFSNRNPLIGQPDGYSLDYPEGIEASGEFPHFDYRAALVSLPATHEGYTPSPSRSLRPAIGAGVTPFTGLRIGTSFTIGPYLNKFTDQALLAGKNWSDYDQRLLAFDFAFSRGYLETHAEFAYGSYDVPGRSKSLMGVTYYGEAKYTFTPRFFLAARAERNRYPFIRPLTMSWVAKPTDFVDGEIGAGYRLRSKTLIKASVAADRWWVSPSGAFLGTGGRAFALQLSQEFDVLGLLERP